MKKATLIITIVLLATKGFSQGWVGNATNNSLYSINSSLSLSPLSIGIGTNTPTEQLHTTAGVRFQGVTQNNSLTQILTSDSSGKLFWRDVSTIISSININSWNLKGNTSTNPGTAKGQNYLGTGDNQRLVVATNGAERMTIQTNGNVGIGTQNPTTNLHVAINPGTMLHPYEVGVFEKSTDTKLGIYCSTGELLGGPTGGAALVFGYSATTNNNGDFPGYEIQYGALSGSDFFLRFNSLNRDATGIVTNSNSNEMVINNGNVGINLGPTSGVPIVPTAKLHVNCAGDLVFGATSNIRFENLQKGSGNYLVIDENGYVQRSSLSTLRNSDNSSLESLEEKLKETKREIAALKDQIKAIEAKIVSAPCL